MNLHMNRNSTTRMTEPSGMIQNRSVTLLVRTQVFRVEAEAFQEASQSNIIVSVQSHVYNPGLNTEVWGNIGVS